MCPVVLKMSGTPIGWGLSASAITSPSLAGQSSLNGKAGDHLHSTQACAAGVLAGSTPQTDPHPVLGTLLSNITKAVIKRYAIHYILPKEASHIHTQHSHTHTHCDLYSAVQLIGSRSHLLR